MQFIINRNLTRTYIGALGLSALLFFLFFQLTQVMLTFQSQSFEEISLSTDLLNRGRELDEKALSLQVAIETSEKMIQLESLKREQSEIEKIFQLESLKREQSEIEKIFQSLSDLDRKRGDSKNRKWIRSLLHKQSMSILETRDLLKKFENKLSREQTDYESLELTQKILDKGSLSQGLTQNLQEAYQKEGTEQMSSFRKMEFFLLFLTLFSFLYQGFFIFRPVGKKLQQLFSRLRTSEAIKKAILKMAKDSIITFTDDGEVLELNSAARKLLNWEVREKGRGKEKVFIQNILKEKLKILDPPELLKEFEKAFCGRKKLEILERYFQNDDHFEVLLQRGDGETFSAEIYLARSFFNRERLYTLFLRDISERKKYQMELMEAKDIAEMALKARTDFLSKMGHEIRNPLHVIGGMGHLLEKSGLNSTQRQYHDVIKKTVQGLTTFLNTLLDHSFMESGNFPLHYESFNLRQLIDDILESHSFLALEKKLNIQFTIDDQCPQKIKSDPTRIKQVLNNLLGNAIKFTDKGGVSLHVSSFIEQDELFLKMLVSDTGIGIAEDKLNSIFESFTQEDSTINKKFGGSGLGLSIARQIIFAFGGRINVASTKGKGSTFTLEWPVEEVKRENVYREEINPLKILSVDDSSDNQMLIRNILGDHGFIVDEAYNGQEALDKIITNPYDLILLDYQMPLLNGEETASKIRDWEKIQGRVPLTIFMISAHEFSSRKKKANLVQEYFYKPLDFEKLLKSIKGQLQSPTFEEIPTSSAPLISSLIEKYLGNRRNELKNLWNFLEQENWEQLEIIGHRLKGNAGSYGLPQLGCLGKDLERGAIEKNSHQIKMILENIDVFLKNQTIMKYQVKEMAPGALNF